MTVRLTNPKDCKQYILPESWFMILLEGGSCYNRAIREEKKYKSLRVAAGALAIKQPILFDYVGVIQIGNSSRALRLSSIIRRS
jgi:hypothetical protein